MSKPRLRRLRWLYTNHPLYFLTTCTAGRRRLLANAEIHAALIHFARRAEERGVWVGRYVIMPDHLHLFAGFGPSSPALSEWMKAVKRSLANVLKAGDEPGPWWQERFFDHVLRSAESYREKWEYVQQNPVRAGLAREAGEWPYQGEIHALVL